MTTLIAGWHAFRDVAMGHPARSTPPRVRALSRDRIERVARPLGRTVCCIEGTLWLTFDGDCRDVILRAGGCHLCDRDTTLTLQALDGPARLTLR